MADVADLAGRAFSWLARGTVVLAIVLVLLSLLYYPLWVAGWQVSWRLDEALRVLVGGSPPLAWGLAGAALGAALASVRAGLRHRVPFLLGVGMLALAVMVTLVWAATDLARREPAASGRPVELGTVTPTDKIVHEWKGFIARSAFKSGERVCGYGEGLNVAGPGGVDVTTWMEVAGPASLHLRQDRHMTGPGPNVWYSACFSLPRDAPGGEYRLRFGVITTNTGQQGEGEVLFSYHAARPRRSSNRPRR